MASDQPVAPPVTDKPEQGVVATADGAPVSAQGASGEENAAHDPSAASSAAPPTTTPDAVARAADAEPHPKAAAPSYEDAQGPTEFAQYIFFQMGQRSTTDPDKLVKTIEACVARKFGDFAQILTEVQDRARRQEDEWRQKESEWKRLDKARKTARLQFETATRARLADEVEREQGAALEREKTEAVEQERAWWESAMENLAAQHKQEVQRVEAHARHMADERDAAERATQTREEEHARALRQLRREHRADVGRVGDRQAEMQGELRDARRGKAQLQREAMGFRDEAQRELDRRVAEVQDHQYPDKIKKLKLRYRRLEQEVESKKDELARERDEIAARWEHEAENLGVQHEQELKEYRHRLDELKRTRREEKEAWKLARAEEERSATAAAKRELRLSRRLRELGQDPQTIAATSPTEPEAPPGALSHELDAVGDFGGDSGSDEEEANAEADNGGAGQEELGKLREAHEVLQQEKDSLAAELHRLRGIAAELQYSMETDEERRSTARQLDLEQIRQGMMDNVRAEIGKLEASKKQAEQTRLQAVEEKATLEQEKGDLQLQNEALSAQLAKMRETARQLQEAMEGDEAKRSAALQKDLDQIRAKLEADVRGVVAKLERAQHEAEQRRAEAEQEKDDVQGQKAALVAQLKTALATAAQLRTELEDDEDEREAEAEARIEAQRAAITNSVRDVIERLSAAKKAAEAELAALRQQNSDLTARLDTLGAMLRQFEADLAGDEGRRAGARDKDLAQIRQTMTDSVRDVVTNLEQARGRAEQARAATARDKAELEQKLRRLDHAHDGAADEAHAVAELARYRDAVARALDAHDAGLAQARRAASLAGEPDTLTELGRLVEADCAAIDAVHRQAVAAQGRPGGELTKIRAIRTRLSLHNALMGALRRQEPPPSQQQQQQQTQSDEETESSPSREERKHGGRGFVAVITPLGVVQAAAFVFFLAAAVAEGHRYSLWSVANATTRSMMAEGSFYTCIGLPPMAYFVDWLLQVLGRRA